MVDMKFRPKPVSILEMFSGAEVAHIRISFSFSLSSIEHISMVIIEPRKLH